MISKFITVLFFIAWIVYWQIEQRKAYNAKPLASQKLQILNTLGRIGIVGLFVLVFVQLLEVVILPIQKNIPAYQITGMILVLLGMAISVSARVVLSSNWSNGYEYQIKKGQELITHGIYKFIRHPIYSGMVISFIGAEMVAGSWLWISFLALFLGAYIQGKREEKILIAYFGNAYKIYMKKSKMLIPFIF